MTFHEDEGIRSIQSHMRPAATAGLDEGESMEVSSAESSEAPPIAETSLDEAELYFALPHQIRVEVQEDASFFRGPWVPLDS